MFKLIGRILRFAGESAGRLRGSFVVSFFESLFSNVPILVLLYVLMRILNGTLDESAAWISGGVMLSGILIQCVLRRIYVEMESGAGYEICARERMALGPIICPTNTASIKLYSPMTTIPMMAGRLNDSISLKGFSVNRVVRVSVSRFMSLLLLYS